MDRTMSPRTAEVLHAIVQAYIETGEPVASRIIARRRRDHISPATIRNIMADLADEGYLDQPHTSAGRVPTAKAFRHFAESLAAHRLLSNELIRLRSDLNQLQTVDQRAERATSLLTELTRNVGIAAAIPTATLILDQIELLALPDLRVLMVVVTRDGMVRNQLVHLDEPVSQDDLTSIRNYVNFHFAGWTLPAIRLEMERRLELESAAYDSLLRRLTILYSKGLLDIGLTPVVYLNGASNLVGLDLHLTKEKLRDLLHALEEKKRLIEILDQFLGAGGEQVQVRVGLREAHPALDEFALIGLTIELPGGLAARMAVLGPMRMNYPRVMSAVLHVGEALRTLHS
jgi:heat-inducible transcriptional repressor